MTTKKVAPASLQNISRCQIETKDKLARYTAARKSAITFHQDIQRDSKIGACLTTKQKKHLNDLEQCGSYLWFRKYYTIDQVKLAKSNYCNHYLICPFCAIRRAAVNSAKAIQRIETHLNDHPGQSLHMITLTVKNGDDLSERIQHLKTSWSKMLSRRRLAINTTGKRNYSAIEHVQGGIKSIEVKRGKRSGQWHPHLHQVVIAPAGYLPDTSPGCENAAQTAISHEWHQITGDSMIVDCRPISGVSDGSLIKSLSEVFKYALKFADLTYQDRYDAWSALAGRRLCDTWGCLRGLKIERAGSDNLDDYEGLPYIEEIYRWIASGFTAHRVANVSATGARDVTWIEPAYDLNAMQQRASHRS